MPNVGAQLLPEASATQERTLAAVSCSALFGTAGGMAWTPSARPIALDAPVNSAHSKRYPMLYPLDGELYSHIPRIRFGFFHITIDYFGKPSDIVPVSLIPTLESDYFIPMHTNLGITEFVRLGSFL
jgi:hypothetical protein